jgi:hypothetical protein
MYKKMPGKSMWLHSEPLRPLWILKDSATAHAVYGLTPLISTQLQHILVSAVS